jgi:hypothetical protein
LFSGLYYSIRPSLDERIGHLKFHRDGRVNAHFIIAGGGAGALRGQGISNESKLT